MTRKMAPLFPTNTNVTMEAALVEVEEASQSEYRFLVDGRFIKYLHVAPRTFLAPLTARVDPFTILRHYIPPFPSGDWNHARLCRDEQSDSIVFTTIRKDPMGGVRNIWHPSKLIDYHFTRHGQLREGVHVCTHPGVNSGQPVVVKYAVWPWCIFDIEAETSMYQRLNEMGLTPRFLGHLVDGEDPERVYGTVTKFFPDGRPAGPHDFDACHRTLSRLHFAGVVHRSLSRFSFIVQSGNQNVMLMDFERGSSRWDDSEAQAEIDNLASTLQDQRNIDVEGNPYDGRIHPLKAMVKVFKS